MATTDYFQPNADAAVKDFARSSASMPSPSTPITSSALSPAAPFNVTQPQPATEMAGLGGVIEQNATTYQSELDKAATEAQTSKSSSLQDLLKGLNGAQGESQLTSSEYAKTGVNTAQSDLKDINNQILAEQLSARRQVEALQKNPQGLYGGALEQKIQEINDKSTARQADLSVIQLAKQGKYDSAKQIADRAVAAKMEGEKNKIAALQLNYEDNKDLFTTAEKRSFESAQADRQRKLDQQTYQERAKYDQLIKQQDPLYQAQLSKARADATAAQDANSSTFTTDENGNVIETGNYNALTIGRYNKAANASTAILQKNPTFKNIIGSSAYLDRIEAAVQNPGSVGDQELLDAFTQLNTGGNRVTEAQVHLITNNQSINDLLSKAKNKLTTGGALSDDQRTQIVNLAHEVYKNYQASYKPLYDDATKRLQAQGVPKQFWNIPDPSTLSRSVTEGGGGSTQGAVPADPEFTKWLTENGLTH